MYLTKEEESILNGEKGEGLRKMMKLVIGLATVAGAERLIKIESAHVSGISYENIGDEGLSFLEWLMKENVHVSVPTTINPGAIDLQQWKSTGVSEDYYEKQKRIVDAYIKLGAKPTLSCTPYFLDNVPSPGSHLAWAESSAVIYANTFLNVYTNKESGLSALAAAVIGKTGYYGLHLDENRKPKVIVKVKVDLSSSLDFGILGYRIGELVGDSIPAIIGAMPKSISDQKQFSAGLSASGTIGMVKFLDNTVEAEDKIEIDEKEMMNVRARFTSLDIDAVYLGCPHLSLLELRELASLLGKRRVKQGKSLLLYTSISAYKIAYEEGFIKVIEKSGAKVFAGACPVFNPKKSNGVIGTDAIKTAHYLNVSKGARICITENMSLIESVTEVI
ncbi:MAG: aconitase X catalytic domain-containing protein [Thermoprotei archaeon]